MELFKGLIGFQYEFRCKKIFFDEEYDIPNTREKSRKSQSVTE